MVNSSSQRLCWLLAAACLAVACGSSTTPTTPSAPLSPQSSQFSEASFREAARITAVAGNDVLATARAGQFERDVKAIIDGVFNREGSGAPAFAHIVASGPNALDLHYPGDTRQLADGELFLIDIGATSNGHCADMSRTYPVSGRFTPRQLELYQLVLEGQKTAAGARTGVDSVSDLDHLVRDFFRASPLRAKDSNGVETTMDRFFVHSIGHYVGRQVHGADTGWNSSLPIEINQVFTLEPGLYIASERIGIRIEDTYLVRTHALECLTCAAHKEPAEIQRLW